MPQYWNRCNLLKPWPPMLVEKWLKVWFNHTCFMVLYYTVRYLRHFKNKTNSKVCVDWHFIFILKKALQFSWGHDSCYKITYHLSHQGMCLFSSLHTRLTIKPDIVKFQIAWQWFIRLQVMIKNLYWKELSSLTLKEKVNSSQQIKQGS